MRILLLFLCVTGISISHLSCTRKGEGDPLISLRSRKARLDGKWKIVSGKGTYEMSQINYPWIYDGNTLIYSSSSVPDQRVSLVVEFGKDGKYEWTRVEEIPTSGGLTTIVETGNWNFKTGKDDSRRKEEIVLEPEHVFPTINLVQQPHERVFELHTLRNNKVVLKRSFFTFNYLGYNPSDRVNTEEWTLEPVND
ncbi:MAG: hypothetical protein IM638_15150 [Bacteroidetes bacterium]|nr:hypothetical protein [Bacteroidota bacterium]